MSLNIHICPEPEKIGIEKFPEHLSQFFEQYHGFGEASEVAQVEAILGIDLSLFQNYGSSEDKNIPSYTPEEFIALIRKFIAAIHAHPNYYQLVKHTGVPGHEFRKEFLESQVAKDDANLVRLLKRWQNTPDSAFPPDTKYLSDGKLLFDLIELEKIFVFLWNMKAKKVRLVYKPLSED